MYTHINLTAPAGGHTAPDDDEANADGDIMPYDASDIDSAQLRGRYDARLLSENISGYQAEAQTSADDEEATSCRNANAKYVHGQKVSRFNLTPHVFTFTPTCRAD